MFPYLFLAIGVIGIDQLVKFWAASALSLGHANPIIPGLFNLTLVHNTGAAFGLLAGAGGWQRFLLAAIAITAAVVIVYLLRKTKNDVLVSSGLALILGGALGNLIDRVAYGYVIDFLDFYLFNHHWPAFNIADSAITVGAAILIFDAFRPKPQTMEAGHKL